MDQWTIPADTVFFGNNITARTRDVNKMDAGSYIDPNIVLSKGVLQEFHYYISDAYAASQAVYFPGLRDRPQIWKW